MVPHQIATTSIKITLHALISYIPQSHGLKFCMLTIKQIPPTQIQNWANHSQG